MRKLLIHAALGAAMTLGSFGAAQAETLRLATNWGTAATSVKKVLSFVDEFNASDAAKAADLQIMHIGGPEVTPATEQLTALENGVIDLLFGAAGYYVGQVPEGFALYGTSISPMKARDQGAMELFDQAYIKGANAKVLGWVAAGVGYHIWLKDEPKLDANGLPDLSGIKVRSSGFYNKWLESFGATTVAVPAPDIYTALERGVVDGAAWPGVFVVERGWYKFTDHVIDPAVWQFDNMIWMNNDAFEGLTDDQKAVLTEAMIRFEADSYDYYEGLVEEERNVFLNEGVSSFRMSAEAEKVFVETAQQLQWAQVQERAPGSYDALRAALSE